MFKLASDFLSLDFLRQQNQKNKPESQFNSLPISQITKEGKVLAIILRREQKMPGPLLLVYFMVVAHNFQIRFGF